MKTALRSAYLVLMVATFLGVLSAQSRREPFVPFQTFLQDTQAASADMYLSRPESHARDVAAFEEMRQHILSMYRGVDVSHSFLLDGNHVDCVPVLEQPSARALALKDIPAPPALHESSTSSDTSVKSPASVHSQIDPEHLYDEFGNSRVCEDQTIPMERITLEQLTRFPTLREFFQKSPGEAEASSVLRPGQIVPPASPGTHVYSFTYSPNIHNIGIADGNNLWSPPVKSNQYFSLSQLWEVGANGSLVQTAETGWQVYPALYGISKAALFIYWTADGYNHTGCYNLSCPAFVQTNNSWILGGGFTHYSSQGGTQYEIDMEYLLNKGKWWLYADGTAVGYYPASQYSPGTMTKYSVSMEFGTESVSSTTVDPPEGSGKWSNAGFKKAAYHRNLNYFSTSGKETQVHLTRDEPSPKCYTVTGPFDNISGWGEYFYDGGPGGSGC